MQSLVDHSNSVCIRKAGSPAIVNIVCLSHCTFEELHDKLEEEHQHRDIAVEIAGSYLLDVVEYGFVAALDRSACSFSNLNDCPDNAECLHDGLRYRCQCRPGTNDTTTDGSGLHCSSAVVEAGYSVARRGQYAIQLHQVGRSLLVPVDHHRTCRARSSPCTRFAFTVFA